MSPSEQFKRTLEKLSPEALINQIEGFISSERKKRIQETLSRRIKSIQIAAFETFDPHNLWAILRSCEALGSHELNEIAPYEQAHVSINSTSGAKPWVKLNRYSDFKSYNLSRKANNFKLYAAVPNGKRSLSDLSVDKPFHLLLGNEKQGLPSKIIERCDDSFSIPMYGMSESLNLSVSAAICLYELLKKRRKLLQSDGELSPKEIEFETAWHYFRQLDTRHRQALLKKLVSDHENH